VKDRAMLWKLDRRTARFLRRAACFLAALLPCACDEDDETTPYPDVSAGADVVVPQCQVDQREIGLDEATPMGVTASELFGWISGPHTEPLQWLNPSPSESHARVDGFGPEQGSSELRLEFEPIGAGLFTRSPLDEASVDLCPTSLGLDVNLHLSTASGALDERVQTTLEVTRADFARLQAVYLPLDGLQGSFTAQISLGPGYDYSQPPQLWLSMTLSEAGVTGKLVLVTLVGNGSSEFGIVPVLARFPGDTDLCQDGMYLVAPDHSVDGVSRDAMLQQLNGASPALLDGGPATLELEYSGVGERACMQPRSASSPTTVWFPAAARLRSSDGRVDGSIQATLRGDAASGTLHSQAAARTDVSDAAAAAATAPSYALLDPIDFSGFDGGSFAFQADVTAASGTGSLIVNGLTDPQCPAVTTTSDPRCTSISTTELWGVRWSKP
jgi:hypothetical protein